MTTSIHTGGCQCGAVRYAIGKLGHAGVCHCRMCQKAFGGFFGPLVTAVEFEWTRGRAKFYASSNKAKRGFCADCGTPLCYDWGGPLEIAIGTLDDPEAAAPARQANLKDKLSFVDQLPSLPVRVDAPGSEAAVYLAEVISFQHPDHDTNKWHPGETHER
jgi:hypothetical protein